MKRRLLGIVVLFLAVADGYAQGRGGGQRGAAQPPQTAEAAAPIDITGYWVSIVTEDWRWRMTTPPKGDYAGVPLNAEARKIADAWDPAKDEASGEQCKSYGAANIMRVPGRIHITWQDDQTLNGCWNTDPLLPLRPASGPGPRLARCFQSLVGVDAAPGLPRLWSARSCGRSGRFAESRDDQNETGVPAKEWRPLQCGHDPYRILRPGPRIQW